MRWRPGFVTIVLLAYAACRLVSAAILVSVGASQEPTGWTGPEVTYLSFTQQWDAQWYRQIMDTGYPSTLPVDAAGTVQQNAWAFYPLYPFLAKALVAVTSADPVLVTSTLSLVLGAAAAVLLAAVLRRRIGPVSALLVVVVWASMPASPVLQVAYSESLAMVLLAGFLLAVETRRWLGAAALALLTGVARPIAAPLAVVALVAAVLRWRSVRAEGGRLGRPEGLRLFALVAACGASGLIWPGIAARATGSLTAYTDTMAAWRGSGTITPLRPWLDNARYFFGEDRGGWVLLGYAVVVLGASLGPWAAGLGPAMRTWGVAYPAYLFVVLDPVTSLFRYLVPIVPLAAVLTLSAGRRGGMPGGPAGPDQWRRPQPYVVAATVIVLAASIAGQYLWTDELWRFVPPSDWPP